MTKICQGVTWALVILVMAVADRAGWIGSEVARTMSIVLPILAVVTLGNGRPSRTGAQA